MVSNLEIGESNRLTICSYDNSGQIKFDVDIEMAQGYWNTSSSRLWTKIRDWMHDDLVEIYKDMRQNGLSYENMMKYFYDDQISKIPQTYYNKDADIKYIPYANQYIGKAHGDGYQHLKRWLKKRLLFCDTLFDYRPAYENDILTIRANTTETMTLEIETYSPVYQHLSWYNNQMDKKKIDGKSSITFTGKVSSSTDQEVLIYGGSNIKSIKGISTMNPDQVLIGSATKLTELDLSNCPILTTVNSDKANFAAHTYLNKLNISNCPQLGGVLKLSNSPLIQSIDAKGTKITGIQTPTSVRNLEVLKLPNTVTELKLLDASMLHTLEFDKGISLQSINLSNCNNLVNCVNFDLTKTPTVILDNSYNAEELYMSETTNLTIKNMSALKRIIYLPNNEYEEFTMDKVINGKSYEIHTFNNPKMKEFITTAPHRTSYKNGEYGDIAPYTVFTANTLDLSDTQFTDIKFLCTTDLYNLKVPTTMKDFYCDSAFDIDTDVIEDASYKVIHDELVEPYTTNYEDEVKRWSEEETTVLISEISTIGQQLVDGDYDKVIDTSGYRITDYIKVVPNTKITISDNGDNKMKFFDKNKTYISGTYISMNSTLNVTVPSNAKYFRFSTYSTIAEITYTTGELYTLSIIPSSASGSLIFNMYSNNTTQPTSTSPYMWDLTGLKLNDFYTYGMNNWVKGNYWFGILPIIYNIDVDTSSGILQFTKGNNSIHCLKVNVGETYCLNKDIDAYYYYARYYGTDEYGTVVYDSNNLVNNTTITVPDGVTILWVKFEYHRNNSYKTQTWNYLIGNGKYSLLNPSTDYKFLYEDIQDMSYKELVKEMIVDPKVVGNAFNQTTNTSITMPQRYAGYSVRMVNADITPNTYPNHLYPLLVDTTLPITGKLDYTKYQGSSLAWAYAYTTSDVSIKPLDSQHQQNITNDYNKLYNTDYVDIIDVWAYKEDDFTNRETNTKIKKVYIELTQSNYKSRIDEVLKWYPNCTDIYLFEDGSVTSLQSLYDSNNMNTMKQVYNIYFMEGYFSSLTNMNRTFRHLDYCKTINNIPNSVTSMVYCFEYCGYSTSGFTITNLPSNVTNLYNTFTNSTLLSCPEVPKGVTNLKSTFSDCEKINQQFDLSKLQISDSCLSSTWNNCTSLTHTPILPSNYKGSLNNTFKNTKITTTPEIPKGVNNMDGTFYGCSLLTVASAIPNGVTALSYIFYNCYKLQSIASIPITYTSPKANELYYLLGNCNSLTKVGLTGLRTTDLNYVNNFGWGTSEFVKDLVKNHLYDYCMNELNISTGGVITLNGTQASVTKDMYGFNKGTPLVATHSGVCSVKIFKIVIDGVTFLPALDSDGKPCIMRTDNNKCYYDTASGTITYGITLKEIKGCSIVSWMNFTNCSIVADDIIYNASNYSITYYFREPDNYPINSYTIVMAGFRLYMHSTEGANEVATYNSRGYYEGLKDSNGNKIRIRYYAGASSRHTLTLGEKYLAYLTEDEISSATNKGWTLQ